MSDKTRKAYEAMFLASQQVAMDFESLIEHIRQLLQRAGAEVIAMQKWDERRLAYEIDKQRRGVYILAYFHADIGAVALLERDCNISEQILRVLVTRADHLTEDEMRVHDRSDELQTEARLRAERAVQREVSAAKVERIGDEDAGEDDSQEDERAQAAASADE